MQTAASELELRIKELEDHDERVQGFLRRSRELLDAMREQAHIGPVAGSDLISLNMPATEAPVRRAQQA